MYAVLMKRLSIIAVAALGLLLWACGGKGGEAPERMSLMEASKQELATALEERDQLLALVRDISTGMNQIKHLESSVELKSSGCNDTPLQSAQLLSQIADVQRLLKERRERLAELEAKFQESALFSDDLQSTIELLRNQIEGQSSEIEALRKQLLSAHAHIESLNSEVDSLSTTVAAVSQELDSAQAESLRLENELNACFYVVAGKSQLKREKIIETGFLRKARLMKGDFNSKFFTVADKRRLQTLELGSGKFKVLTNHPDGSYEIASAAGGVKTLVIISPERFWSLTNYLVVQAD